MQLLCELPIEMLEPLRIHIRQLLRLENLCCALPLRLHLPQLFFVFVKLLHDLRIDRRRIRFCSTVHICPREGDPTAQLRTPNKGCIALLFKRTERLRIPRFPVGLLLQNLIIIGA